MSLSKKFVGICGAYVLVYFDASLVSVALPSIQRGLETSHTTLSWIVNSYLLMLSVFVIFGGRLGDILGLKKIYLIGVSIFGLSVFGATLAPNASFLITCRVFEGIGAALMMPVSQALIYHLYPHEKRGIMLGLYGGAGVLFLTLGPFLGGLLTEFVSWRMIFLLNGLCSLFFFWMIIKNIPEVIVQKHRARIDIFGQITLMGMIVPLVFYFMTGIEYPSLLLITLISLFFFLRREKKNKQPLINLKMFKSLTFSGTSILFFIIQLTWIATIFFSLFFQNALHFSPFIAGILLLPSSIASIFLNPIAGKLSQKWGCKPLVVLGMFLLFLAMGFLSLFAFKENYFYLLPSLLVYSVACSFFFPPNMRLAMHSVTQRQQGVAAGVGLAARQIGGSLGYAVISLVYFYFIPNLVMSFSMAMLIICIFTFIGLIIALTMLDEKVVSKTPQD